METIKVHDYGLLKKKPFTERFKEYWTSMKPIVMFIFAITFIQIITLILTIWVVPYIEGIILNIAILFVLMAYLVFESTNRKIRTRILKKIRLYIKFLTMCLVPLVIMFFVITVLLITYMPYDRFPAQWKFKDNNCARFASVDKFRVTPIELKYPVTFKIPKDQLNDIVVEWMRNNNHKFVANNLTAPLLGDIEELEYVGNSYHFSNHKFATLFGMINDIHLQVIECDDVWGGVKLEAHSNLRLGLKDYDGNLDIIESLYKHIQMRTQNLNVSYLLCEHRQYT